MSLLTESHEVWLPMPGQDLDTTLPKDRRYYLFRTFTHEDDALNAAREASGGAVIKVNTPAGVRVVVQRPARRN